MTTPKMTTLYEAKIGQKIKIENFSDSNIKCDSSRFGLDSGEIVTCIAKPGPIVVRKNHQEIAIGRNLSKKIKISLLYDINSDTLNSFDKAKLAKASA